MASKSKKRRRVLGASCILAALIIAGSSFAWFTSKDEVTNRLTANSDYGVSIVESFAPPKNMLPGQEVNKDVYAVNTGSIDAFVKETVSGKLNYTYEALTDTFSATDCLSLTPAEVTAIDGATTNEAGGFLAWNNAGVENGVVNSARQGETPAVADRWTPTVSGDYIFRRSIDTTDPDNPTFTYAGYHYDADKDDFYKIRIGNDPFRASFDPDHPEEALFDVSVEQNKLGDGITVDKDGVITAGNPKISYVKEVEVENKTPKLTFHAQEGTNPAYIEAYYAESMAVASSDLAAAQTALVTAEQNLLDDSRIVADAEVEYENAKGAYNTAKSRYDQTKADYDYAKALATATNALYDAADARMLVELTKQDKKQLQDEAQDEVNQEATDLASDYATLLALKADTAAISYNNLLHVGETNDVEAQLTAMQATLPNAYQNMQDLKAEWTKIKTAAGAIDTALTTLKGENVTADQADAAYASLNTNLNDLRTALNAYNSLYAHLKTATASEPQLTGLLVDSATTAISTLKTSADNMRNEVDAAGGLAADVVAFRNAWDTYAAYSTATTGHDAVADAAWEKAVRDYNDDVETAKSTYNEAINKVQPLLNNYPDMATGNKLKDNSATIIASYGAANSNTTTGKLATDPSYPLYTTYTGTPTGTAAGHDLAVTSLTDKDAGTEATFMSYVSDSTDKSLKDLSDIVDGTTGNVKSDYDSKKGAYETAVANRTTHQKNKTDAEAAIAEALATDPSAIKFIITLANDLNWTSDNATDADQAEFYYNKILAAGATSDKLIDSVTLDKSTTVNDYKKLTFDLNVDLDSAQVTYAADQKTVTTDAVVAPAFNKTATVAANNTDVSWS